jgi:hypothetical protein
MRCPKILKYYILGLSQVVTYMTMKFDSKYLTMVVVIAAGLVFMSIIAAPVSASTGTGPSNALQDRGQQGVSDTGLCLADKQIHDQFGFGSPQDLAFHAGLAKAGVTIPEFIAQCPHLQPP